LQSGWSLNHGDRPWMPAIVHHQVRDPLDRRGTRASSPARNRHFRWVMCGPFEPGCNWNAVRVTWPCSISRSTASCVAVTLSTVRADDVAPNGYAIDRAADAQYFAAHSSLVIGSQPTTIIVSTALLGYWSAWRLRALFDSFVGHTPTTPICGPSFVGRASASMLCNIRSIWVLLAMTPVRR
jgi:hypothetical protein